jgi:hypothetical protein
MSLPRDEWVHFRRLQIDEEVIDRAHLPQGRDFAFELDPLEFQRVKLGQSGRKPGSFVMNHLSVSNLTRDLEDAKQRVEMKDTAPPRPTSI